MSEGLSHVPDSEKMPVSYSDIAERKVGGAQVRNANNAFERANQRTTGFGDIQPATPERLSAPRAPSTEKPIEQLQAKHDAMEAKQKEADNRAIEQIRAEMGLGGDTIPDTATPWSEPVNKAATLEARDVESVKDAVKDVDSIILNEAVPDNTDKAA
jgi:hypothetical protein